MCYERSDDKIYSSFKSILIWCTLVFNVGWFYVAICMCDFVICLYIAILWFYVLCILCTLSETTNKRCTIKNVQSIAMFIHKLHRATKVILIQKWDLIYTHSYHYIIKKNNHIWTVALFITTIIWYTDVISFHVPHCHIYNTKKNYETLVMIYFTSIHQYCSP